MARLADPALADRRRQQILDAALRCFRKRGFHQATMQEICTEADMSAGALYRYFPSKAEIIGAIAEDSRGESDDSFARHAESFGLVEALCLACREFMNKLADGDGALVAEILAEAIRDVSIAKPLRSSNAHSLAALTRAIQQGQAQGDVDITLDARATADTLFAAIEGIGLRRAFLGETDVEAAVAQFRILVQRYLNPLNRVTSPLSLPTGGSIWE